MAKIVLSVDEITQIIVNHLASTGQIEPRVANVTWNINRFSPEILSGVTVEQEGQCEETSAAEALCLKQICNNKTEVVHDVKI